MLINIAINAGVAFCGFLVPIIWRQMDRVRLIAVLGADRARNVPVVMGVWSVADHPDGKRYMDKVSPTYGATRVNYVGAPEMLARDDVNALAEVTEALSKITRINPCVLFDTHTPDLQDGGVIIGSAVANDVSRRIQEHYGAHDEASLPIRIEIEPDDPDSMVIHAGVNGRTFRSDSVDEYAVIYRVKNPFSEKNNNLVFIWGQFANGTRVSATYFAKNWRSVFRWGRRGVVLKFPKNASGPVTVACRL